MNKMKIIVLNVIALLTLFRVLQNNVMIHVIKKLKF